MPKGKHKAKAVARNASAAVIALMEVEDELAVEVAALAQAEHAAERAGQLRVTLAQVSAERDAHTQPAIERLRAEERALQDAIEHLAPAAQRVGVAWQGFAAHMINRFGGGREGLEFLLHALGATAGGLVNVDPHVAKVGSRERIQQLQVARGQRRSIRELPQIDEQGRRAAAPLLRALHQDVLLKAGLHPSTPQHRRRTSLDHLPAALRAAVGIADAAHDRVADAPFGSRLAVSDPDVVAALHPGPLIDLDGQELLTSTLGGALGFVLTRPDDDPIRPAAAAATLGHTAEHHLALLAPTLERRQAIIAASGRFPTQLTPPARHPRPGDCLALQQAYTLSAISCWLHEEDTTDLQVHFADDSTGELPAEGDAVRDPQFWGPACARGLVRSPVLAPAWSGGRVRREPVRRAAGPRRAADAVPQHARRRRGPAAPGTHRGHGRH